MSVYATFPKKVRATPFAGCNERILNGAIPVYRARDIHEERKFKQSVAAHGPAPKKFATARQETISGYKKIAPNPCISTANGISFFNIDLLILDGPPSFVQ